MKSRTFLLWGLAVLAAVGLVMGGCGSDGGGGGKTFRAFIQHFGGDDLVADVTVHVVDNATGQKAGQSAVSDGTGWVTFTWTKDMPAKVGFLCEEKSGWKDTYQYNIDSAAQDEKLWYVDETTYNGAPLMAGIYDFDPTKAALAGGIYWVNAQDKEEHIGCATVKANPESGRIRYFGDNGLPTTLETRTTTNPIIAYYLITNLEPGTFTTEAYIDTTMIGSTQLTGFGGSICISNIYAEGLTANPMPANCE